MFLVIVVLYLLLPLPGVLLYLASGAIGLSGFDTPTMAPLAGIAAFSWLAGQFWLAARLPWMVKHLGLAGLNRLHGSGGLLVLGAGTAHWYMKFVVQMVPPDFQTLLGISALGLVTLAGLGAVLLLSNHFPSPAKALKGLRKTAERRLGLGYKAVRSLHNATVLAVLAALVHVLLASSTGISWFTQAWMIFLVAGGCGMYVAYRLKGRKWKTPGAGVGVPSGGS